MGGRRPRLGAGPRAARPAGTAAGALRETAGRPGPRRTCDDRRAGGRGARPLLPVRRRRAGTSRRCAGCPYGGGGRAARRARAQRVRQDHAAARARRRAAAPSAGPRAASPASTSSAPSRRRTWLLRRAGSGSSTSTPARTLRPELDVLDNVALQLRLAGVGGDAGARAGPVESLDLLGLAHLADRRPATLSGGEAQRVAVAAALAHRPALVLADEPTGELDPDAADAVYDLLARRSTALGAALRARQPRHPRRAHRRPRRTHPRRPARRGVVARRAGARRWSSTTAAGCGCRSRRGRWPARSCTPPTGPDRITLTAAGRCRGGSRPRTVPAARAAPRRGGGGASARGHGPLRRARRPRPAVPGRARRSAHRRRGPLRVGQVLAAAGADRDGTGRRRRGRAGRERPVRAEPAGQGGGAPLAGRRRRPGRQPDRGDGRRGEPAARAASCGRCRPRPRRSPSCSTGSTC